MADSGPHTPEVGGPTLTTRTLSLDYEIDLSYRRIFGAVQPQLKVLYNEDLLIHIFSFFDPHIFLEDRTIKPIPSTLKALLFVCLTCRTFFKPASDLMWRNMTSLMPLFKILPTFVKVNDVYVFTGVIQPIHMERFRTYARKIRGLDIRTFPENIAGHSIHRLSTISNIQPFFPALKTVRLSAPFGEYAPLFLIHGNLLSNIKVINISSKNESLISSFLLHLSEKNPTIQRIALDGKLSPQILVFLKDFRRLQHVDLAFHTSSSPITATVLQDLGNLPDLRYMGLSVDVDMDDTASIIRTRTIGFRALNSLEIGGLPTTLQKILQFISEAPELKGISCCLDAAPQASIQGCIAEMCRVGRNVKNFTVAVDELSPRSVVGPMSVHSGTDSLDLFIHCRQLSSLDISDVLLPTNLDESIRCLCENGAWRNMQILELRPLGHPAADSAASLKSLRVLAQCCPVLIDVTIPIDFALHTASSLHQECQHPRTPYHPLKCLSILPRNLINHTNDPSSSTQLAGLVARFLEHYFPNLVGDRCQLYTDDEGDFQWWDVVKMVMEQLSSLRAEVEQQSL